MSGAEWVYKYIFETKRFRIAKIKSNAEHQRKEYKLPKIIFEYRINQIWYQKGILNGK